MGVFAIRHIQFAVAEVCHFRAILQEADPVIGNHQFQFVCHFAKQDLSVLKPDVLAYFLKFCISPGSNSRNVCAELVKLDFNCICGRFDLCADGGYEAVGFVFRKQQE